MPGAAGNACGEQAAEGRADADARWAVLDRNREVFALEQEIRTLRARCEALAAVESEFTALGESRSWRWTRPLRVLLGLLLREPAYVGQLRSLTRWIHSRGLGGWLHALFPPDSPIEQMGVPRPRRRRDVSVDIVVLIDGQVALVRQCLDAVLRSTLPPYRLFLMDVSGKPEIDAYLDRLAATHGAQLLPHDPSLGVGRTLYAALQPEKGWLALLRDDTIVSEGWLDALMQAAAIYPRAAVVGPLTTAMLHEWLPATEQGAIIGETTTGLADLDDIAAAVLRVGCRQPIAVRHLDGACLLVRRELLNASTGVDARTLAKGIELNPTPWSWTRRWRPRLLLADDVYVETRAKPTGRCRQSEQNAVGVDANRGDTNAGRGSVNIESDTCHLIALAATCGRLAEEIQWGRAALSRNPRLEGRRVAFLMPAGTVSAGIAALLDQAQALRDLGVDAWIVRVGLVRPPSEAVSPAFQLPVLWARSARDVQTTLADVDIRFDAVVAVGMDMLGALPLAAGPICGCYLPADSRIEPAVLGSEQRALLRRPTSGRLRLLAQIGGTAESLAKQLAVQSGVVGASIDTAVFRPSPAMDVGNRAPRISVLLGRDLEGAGLSLWELPVRLRSRLRLPMPVDAVLAADLSLALKDPAATESLADLSPQDLSIRLRRSDIFLDLSDSPAGEFVTLAAMACGCAVIISCTGTGPEFARHEGNALIVANADQDAPIAAVARLAADHVLCDRLRRQAALDAAARPHRRAALALAITLFDGDLEARRH